MDRNKLNEAIELLAEVHSSVYNPDDHRVTESLLSRLEMTMRAALHNDVQPVPDTSLYDGTDRRLDCWFCPGVQSVALAPRHSGGDVDVPAHWVPVCERHAEHWHDEIDAEEMLPIIPRNGVHLTVEQARLAQQWAIHSRVGHEGDRDAYEAIETGLRTLRDIADPNETPDPSEPGAAGNDERRYDETGDRP